MAKKKKKKKKKKLVLLYGSELIPWKISYYHISSGIRCVFPFPKQFQKQKTFVIMTLFVTKDFAVKSNLLL